MRAQNCSGLPTQGRRRPTGRWLLARLRCPSLTRAGSRHQTPRGHAVAERRFLKAASFNQAIGRWDMARVASMKYLYVAVAACCCCCGTFSWSSCGAQLASPLLVTLTHPTPRPTRCRFDGARSFNQNVGLWDVSRVKAMDSMYVAAFPNLATD